MCREELFYDLLAGQFFRQMARLCFAHRGLPATSALSQRFHWWRPWSFEEEAEDLGYAEDGSRHLHGFEQDVLWESPPT